MQNPFVRSPRTASRSGLQTATVQHSTLSWALSLLLTTTQLVTAENGWWKHIASSASKHASGSHLKVRRSFRHGRKLPRTDSRHRSWSRRERSGDFRDVERSWGAAFRSRLDQEPSYSSDCLKRAQVLRLHTKGIGRSLRAASGKLKSTSADFDILDSDFFAPLAYGSYW
jgi:hypothetical protein